jgi:hypothetical protein
MGQADERIDIPCIREYPEESVVLFTDRDYYIAGEPMWFKAFVFFENTLSSDWSKVLYVEIFNHQQDVFVQRKFELVDGMVDNLFDIPQNINTGHYFLRAYTQYNRNLSAGKLFTKVISVINPESEKTYIDEPLIKTKENGFHHQNIMEAPKNIKISLQKDQFAPREKVDFEINGSVPAFLTISVRKKGTGYTEKEIQEFMSLNSWLHDSYLKTNLGAVTTLDPSTQPIRPDKITWIPEIRGLSLTGKIRNKVSQKPVADVFCISSVIGEEPQVHLSKTNEKGDFVFTYNHLIGEKDIFIAIRNRQNKDLEILINKDFSTDYPELQAMPFPFDSSKHELFRELYMNSQVSDNFTSPYIKGANTAGLDSFPSFNLGEADFNIDVQEFIDLPSLEDIFVELVPTVSLKGKIGSRKLYVFDRNIYRDLDNPLVLLDNVPVNDIENLLLIEPSNLDAISVYNTEYRLGDFSFGGVISLKTNTAEFGGFKWTDNSVFLNFKTLNKRKTFLHTKHRTPDSKSNREPDFRTILYWNPEINFKGNPEQLSFYTSDHLSGYEIIARGFTKDGSPCFGIVDFTVEK